MDACFLDDMREQTIAMVRGIGNMKVWVLFEGEEPRKVGKEGTVGTPESSVCVLPVPFVSCPIRTFLQEWFIQDMPDSECCLKLDAHAVTQTQRDRPQCLGRFCLCSGGDVAFDRLDLMELAALHEDASTRKHLPNPSPSVNDSDNHRASKDSHRINAGGIVADAFCADCRPVQDLINRAADKNAVSPGKVEGIDDGHDLFLPYYHFPRCSGIGIEISPECFRMHIMLGSKIFERMPS